MSDQSETDINKILLTSQSTAEAVRALFYAKKATSPEWSLALLAKRSGIKSRGYLSDLLRGNREMPLETALNLAASFRLTGEQQKVINLLASWESLPCGAERQHRADALKIARKALATQRLQVSDQLRNLLLNLEVYSFVTMHHQGVKFAEIRQYFHNYEHAPLEQGLGDLIRAELVFQEQGVYRSTGKSFLFSDSEDGHSHLDFLRACIHRVFSEADHWFGRNDIAHLESSLITTNRKQYLKKLPTIKEQLLDIQSDLDSDEPNMIISFNVQIVPTTRD